MDLRTMKYNPAFLSEDILKRVFVARQALLESILRTVRENTGGANQHLLVVGSRGMGKTTLVRRVAAAISDDAELRAHWLPIVFTEESYGVSNAGEFWLEAIFHLAESSVDERWKLAYKELAGEKDPGRLRERALSQLIGYAESENKRLLLAVENLEMLFDQITNEESWSIRHTLLNEPRIMLLGTALQKFEEVENSEKAMFELFKTHSLERLSAEECADIWAQITGERLKAERIRPIQILTGGNPRLVTIISNFGKDISFKELLGDLTRLVDEHTEYFKSHLDVLSAVERKVYTGLLELWEPSAAKDIATATRLSINETSAVLARLVAKGAVSARPGRGKAKLYESAERMFNIYWLMRRHGEPSKRLRAVVDFMVHFYGEEGIGGVVRAIAEEAQRLGPESRGLHISAYRDIVYAQSTERWQSKCMESSPVGFLKLPEMPTDVVEKKVKDCGKKGQMLIESGEYEKAVECFDELIKLDVGNYKAWGNKGIALSYLKKSEEAKRCFEEVVKIKPDSSTGWFNMGTWFRDSNDTEKAVECYNKAIAIDPGNSMAWEDKGVMLGRINKHQEALECFEKAIKVGSAKDVYWENKGIALEKLGKYEDSIVAFENALKLNPQNVEAWLGKAISLGRLGRNNDAVQCFDEVIKKSPSNVVAWGNKGILMGRLGNVEQELACFDKVLELDPEDFNAWNNKSVVLGEIGKNQEALKCAEEAIRKHPKNARGWGSKGVILAKTGYLSEAISCFDKALELAPDDAVDLANKGLALSKLGQKDAAIISFRASIARDPEMDVAWIGLNRCLIAENNLAGVIEHLRMYFADALRAENMLGVSIALVEDAAAAGYVDELLGILADVRTSTLEPLIVGLRILKGEAVSAPKEIVEIAQDVAEKIKKKQNK